jgi:hypothetical protein
MVYVLYGVERRINWYRSFEPAGPLSRSFYPLSIEGYEFASSAKSRLTIEHMFYMIESVGTVDWERGAAMKRFLALAILICVGAAAWHVGEKLSSDALSMGLGILFGVLAGIPTALLLLAAGRRRSEDGSRTETPSGRRYPPAAPMMTPAQPPVIVITGSGAPAAPARYVTPGELGAWGPYPPSDAPPAGQGSRSDRRFKVVGEKEEWLDEW